MSRFKLLKHTNGNTALQELYDAAIAAGFAGSEDGVPSNLVTSLGERPDLLVATIGLVKAILLEGLLPGTVKEMMAMSIAMRNNCRYCTSVHTSILKSMGVASDVIHSCATDPDMAEVPPPQRAIIRFALKTSQDPLSVSDEEIQALRDQGLTDPEIVEAAMVAACENFLNTWARVSQLPLDGEE